MTIDERIMALGVRLKRLARSHKIAQNADPQHEEFVRKMAVCTAGVKATIAQLDGIAARPRRSRMSQ